MKKDIKTFLYILFTTILAVVVLWDPVSSRAQFGGFGGFGGISFGNLSNAVKTEFIAPLMKQTEQLAAGDGQKSQTEASYTDSKLNVDTVNASNDLIIDEGIEQARVTKLGCEYISMNKDIPNQRAKRKSDQRVMAQSIHDNATGRAGTPGGLSEPERLRYDIANLRERCTGQEANNALAELCDTDTDPEKLYSDISPETLLGSSTATNPEEVTNYVTNRIRPLPQLTPEVVTDENQRDDYATTYQRLVREKRVLADDLAAIASTRLPGPDGGTEQMRNMLRNDLKLDEEQIDELVPEGSGISEDMRLEVMTKMFTARPQFYTGLITNQAGVARVRSQLSALDVYLNSRIAEMKEIRTRQEALIATRQARRNIERNNAVILSR